MLYGLLTLAGWLYPIPTAWNAFLNSDNQVNGIGSAMSIYAIMAVGMTCVIITGGIDISVGAIMGFSALSWAYVLQFIPEGASWYYAMPVAFGVPILVGGACGALNGAMVVGFRMHPFIVTLSTLSILRGLCVLVFPNTVPVPGKGLPNCFITIMSYDFGMHLRLVPAIVMAVVVILGGIFLSSLVAGRETYAVGGNVEASRYSGIRVWWVILRVYVIMGLCAGIAAVVHLGKYNSVSINDGSGYELLVIASAVVGGASLTGGRGTALGALLGTLIISLIDNGILILRWRTENTKIIIGASIIIAVGIDRISEYLVMRRRRATGSA
jgi:ribose/xylose/arabinose/galactoside ABC-type transport system permease subunit